MTPEYSACPETAAKPDRIIGVVGGVGPYSGLDLAAKIFDQTRAGRDQEHLSVLVYSLPGLIPDRTAFLLDPSLPNPGPVLAGIVRRLAEAGATVVGIPCNTAHAAPIFRVVEAAAGALDLELVNMPAETARHLAATHNPGERLAVLSTLGTYWTGLYSQYLADFGPDVLDPGPELTARVHEAIYHPEYGIKSCPPPVSGRARSLLEDAVLALKKRGLGTVVLGCTELPLAFPEREFAGVRLVDPTLILARALVARAAPGKLKSSQ